MYNTQFIIVDDNKLNCYIAEKMIKKIASGITVKPFIYADEAFEYIKQPQDYTTNILLIDIQMPLMTGFNFVEAFEKLPEDIRDRYKLYIYSSTINEKDKEQAINYSSVRQFFSKPLTHNSLNILLSDIEKSEASN